MDVEEFQESNSITFEWTVKGLRHLFESSKGEAKSKVTKSVKFGGGQWQILFYANAGTGNANDASSHISLFLSCEPTQEEKDNSLNGKWVREGLFRFTFELRNLSKQELFNMKEAHNHSFSYKTANWGWAQFSRRDAVYYQRHSVKTADAFVIVCTITSTPTTPKPPPPIPRTTVPKDLLDSVGSLLDDPLYSDVEFVLPRRGTGLKNAKRIYAAKKLLGRADYFATMFNSGFAEASHDDTPLTIANIASPSETNDRASEVTAFSGNFEDSDEEDEDILDNASADISQLEFEDRTLLPEDTNNDEEAAPKFPAEPFTSNIDLTDDTDKAEEDEDRRNVRAKLSHPSSPRSHDPPLALTSGYPNTLAGPSKMRVVVKDVAYSTYFAVLHYLYTDTIRFAPLSSSFNTTPHVTISTTSTQTPNESQANLGATLRTAQSQGEPSTSVAARSRREWLQQWERDNAGKIALPCSAKAVYRLADKLDLRELRERAFQHITTSLTVENVPYEVFSTFSGIFETVRKVQVKFFLDHWSDIRSSDAMRNVWQQIRIGRHPGFEEVWPVIATNLEFKPQVKEKTGLDPEESNSV